MDKLFFHLALICGLPLGIQAVEHMGEGGWQLLEQGLRSGGLLWSAVVERNAYEARRLFCIRRR
jgi:hypothetical protein